MPNDNIVKKRSVCISGHSTSITLEDEFWDALKDIAQRNKLSLNALISKIDEEARGNLSSALRLYVLAELQSQIKHC